MKWVCFLLFFILFYSCSKGGDDRLAEQEQIRAEEQVEAENDNLRVKAEAMEKDLDKRKRFFNAITGKFKGSMKISNTDYELTVELSPELSIEFFSRVRTLEEINFEIQNLNLQVTVKINKPGVSISGIKCTITGYKSTNINTGLLNIISENCENTIKLYVADDLEVRSHIETKKQAQLLSKDLTSGLIGAVEYFDVVFEPKFGTDQYKFNLQRVDLEDESKFLSKVQL
jgi:hypothetical protein